MAQALLVTWGHVPFRYDWNGLTCGLRSVATGRVGGSGGMRVEGDKFHDVGIRRTATVLHCGSVEKSRQRRSRHFSVLTY